MGRRTGAVLAALALAACVAAPAGAGESAGGGQRWSSAYLAGSPAYSSAIAVTPDSGTVLVSGSTAWGASGRMATLAYDAATGESVWTASTDTSDEGFAAKAMVLSPDAQTVYVTGIGTCPDCPYEGERQYVTAAYDVETGERLWWNRLRADSGSPMSIAASPDGERVFVAGSHDSGMGRQLVAYEAVTGDQLWEEQRDGTAVRDSSGLAVSPDGETVYWAGSDPSAIDDLCWIGGAGMRLAAIDADDGTERWSTGHRVAPEYRCGETTALAMSPDGSQVVLVGYGGDKAGTFDARLVSVEASTGAVEWTRHEAGASVISGASMDLVFSPDGSGLYLLTSACETDTCAGRPLLVVGYGAADGERSWMTPYDSGATHFPSDLAVSPDGATLYAAAQASLPCDTGCDRARIQGPVVALETASGEVRWASPNDENGVEALAVSPDGSSVYYAGSFTDLTGHLARRDCGGNVCGYSTTRANSSSGGGLFDDRNVALDLGRWTSVWDASASAASYRTSDRAGDSVRFRSGSSTSMELLTREGPDQGRALLVLDGERLGVVDLYAPESAPRVVRLDALERAPHTLLVRVLGRASAASTGTSVAVDGFRVSSGYRTYQESAPEVRFDSWRGGSALRALGGSFRSSSVRSAAASFTFRGTSVRLVTATGPAYGRAAVLIDGARHRIDLYAPRRRWQRVVPFTGLGEGVHEIVVRPLGTARRASRGTEVVVDGFRVGGAT